MVVPVQDCIAARARMIVTELDMNLEDEGGMVELLDGYSSLLLAQNRALFLFGLLADT